MIAQSQFNRLTEVRDQYQAAAVALSELARHWGSPGVTAQPGISFKDIQRARANLEYTYFVRLHAEFEGVLKEHIHSASITLRRDPKFDLVVARALTASGKTRRERDRNGNLFRDIRLVHNYRNTIAHGDTPAGGATLQEALRTFNVFLARL